MSNGTKSDYTDTGKKVKSICDGRVDLTYNKVYDVFIDSDEDEDEFIIDDVGDKRYWSIYDDDYYELVDDVSNEVNDTNKPKPKFKVGDKVKVVDTEQISQWTKDIEVEYVGVVVDVNVNVEYTPYKVRLDKCYCDWWFTDKCIELVGDTVDTTNDINETKHKFKVGDKVKVVNTYYISQFVDVINVGDTGVTGVIISIDDNDNITPYLVKFEDSNVRDNWWFTDKCIELIEDSINDVNTPNKKYNPLVVQQSGNHYKNGKIQPIEYSERNNLSMCQGNIIKYVTRHKEKNGVDDLAKVVHYALLEALFVYGEDGATELRDKVDSLINIGNKE